jgi:uncharacterized protein (DUF433 family)
MRGPPCIRDTRITVSAVLGQLAAGASIDDLLADYPYLEREDVLAALDRKELGQARDLARRYRELELALADASLAVLADRHRTDRIASFDERAFRAMTPLRGDAFTVLPADS